MTAATTEFCIRIFEIAAFRAYFSNTLDCLIKLIDILSREALTISMIGKIGNFAKGALNVC